MRHQKESEENTVTRTTKVMNLTKLSFHLSSPTVWSRFSVSLFRRTAVGLVCGVLEGCPFFSAQEQYSTSLALFCGYSKECNSNLEIFFALSRSQHVLPKLD